MEPKDEGLEDGFPFHSGDFQVPAVNFPGCIDLRLDCLFRRKDPLPLRMPQISLLVMAPCC